MERNDVLIDKVMDYLREHPKEWDQRYWVESTPCGTTACFAGHTMLLSGYTVRKVRRGCDESASEDHDCDPHACDRMVTKFFAPDGRRIDDEDIEAGRLLGLSRWDGGTIFYQTSITDAEDMQEIIDNIRAKG